MKKARETFKAFDAADYLKTEADIAAYLAAAAEGNDAAHFARALGTVARARSMSKLARDTGLTREGLYKSLSGDGNPSLDTAMRVIASLGMKIAVVCDTKPATKAKRAKPKVAA